MQTSCLTEIFFVQAMQRAKELDEYYATHGKVKGPFHGLPVSMKVCQRIGPLSSSFPFCTDDANRGNRTPSSSKVCTRLSDTQSFSVCPFLRASLLSSKCCSMQELFCTARQTSLRQ